jgi:predicted nucleic acid-binding protein
MLSAISDLESIKIDVQAPIPLDEIAPTIELCEVHGLTFYDGLYLRLAHKRNATLATLDAAMQRAAIRTGLPLLLEPRQRRGS